MGSDGQNRLRHALRGPDMCKVHLYSFITVVVYAINIFVFENGLWGPMMAHFLFSPEYDQGSWYGWDHGYML